MAEGFSATPKSAAVMKEVGIDLTKSLTKRAVQFIKQPFECE